MSVGILAHLCGKRPYKELAAEVGARGFKHVQLALWKAIADIDFSRPGKLSPGLANAIAEEFDRNGSSISVLGCYVHLFNREEEQRRFNIERFKELLRHARWFGASVVAVEVGKPEAGTERPENWARMTETIKELTEEAAKWGVYVGIEPAEGHLIGTAPELKLFLEEFRDSSIGVVLDPGNLVTTSNYPERATVLEEAFRLLGDRIVAFHAKDLTLRQDGALVSVPAGSGELNYPHLLTRLNELKPHVDLILDAVDDTNMLRTKSNVEQLLGL